MNEEIMNEIQPVRPKDQFTFSCRQCGACCRNIEGCVMVESLDAYCLARYLRAKGEPIEGIEDFLFRYCEPEPLTEEGFPIYMRIKHKYFDEAVPYIDAAVKQTKRLKQISDAAFQRQDIDEIESLALALRKEIEAALQPFYMGHMCLYVTPECFDDPPKTPEIYNDATACVWRDGTWQLLEDTSKGFLLFVQSKSKEESAA